MITPCSSAHLNEPNKRPTVCRAIGGEMIICVISPADPSAATIARSRPQCHRRGAGDGIGKSRRRWILVAFPVDSPAPVLVAVETRSGGLIICRRSAGSGVRGGQQPGHGLIPALGNQGPNAWKSGAQFIAIMGPKPDNQGLWT